VTLEAPRVNRPKLPTDLDLDPVFMRHEALRRAWLADQVMSAVMADEPFHYEGHTLTSGRAIDHARHLRESALVHALLADAAPDSAAKLERERRFSNLLLVLAVGALVAAVYMVTWS
jgi:hypothetical protein